MKVFVVLSHLEYEGSIPESFVEGVFSELTKAIEVKNELFEKQLDLHEWRELDDDDVEKIVGDDRSTIYNNSNGDFVCISVIEREVE